MSIIKQAPNYQFNMRWNMCNYRIWTVTNYGSLCHLNYMKYPSNSPYLVKDIMIKKYL